MDCYLFCFLFRLAPAENYGFNILVKTIKQFWCDFLYRLKTNASIVSNRMFYQK